MRSTENKIIDIPLVTGMNQATSERLSPTGTLSSVRNCRISANGLLEKRPGSLALSGTTANLGGHSQNAHALQSGLTADGNTFGAVSPCFACQVQGALMVGNSSGDAFAYSTIWQFQGRFSTCLPVRRRYGLAVDDVLISGDGFGRTPPDVATTTSGYICVVALTALGTLHLYVEDPAGVRLYYMQDVGTYAKCRILSVSDTIYLFTQATGSTTISGRTFVISGAIVTASAKTSMNVLSASDADWDVSNYNTAEWYIAYQTGAAVVTVQRRNNVTGSPLASQTFAVTGKPQLTTWADVSLAQLWVGYYDDPGVTGVVGYTVFSIAGGGASAITSLKAKTTIDTGLLQGAPRFGRFWSPIPSLSANGAFYVYPRFKLTAPQFQTTCVGREFSNTVGSAGGVILISHILPISKPDNFNRFWCMVESFSSNQLLTKVMLLRIPQMISGVAPAIELSGPNMPTLDPSLNPLAATNTWFFGNGGIGTTRSYAPVPICLQQFYGAQAIVKFDAYEYTTVEQEAHRDTTVVGLATAIAGQPVEFWGQSVATISVPAFDGFAALDAGAAEIGFPYAPIITNIVASNSASALVAGTRSYRCVYEWVDMYGRRHQSAPSNPFSFTTAGIAGGVGSATLTVSSLGIGQRVSQNTGLFPCLRVYRTVVGGTEYHELASTMIVVGGTGDGSITFIDTEADTSIAQTGFLYTDGGVLQHDLAPSCRFTCKSEDRVWFGGLWDSTLIQCSKIIVPQEPIQCTDDASHQVQLPAPCTGLAYMDGTVVAFTADAIYLISGDGPNDQGAGSFPPPRALTRSVGCCDYRSIVETNIGVIFQANSGFYILPRGFGPVQYIGAAVHDEMSPVSDVSPVVLGSISHQTRDNHLARFLVASPGATSATTVLTYDIDGGQWFKDTLGDSIGELGALDSLLSTGSKGAVFVRSDLSVAHSTSPVWVESPTVFVDASGSGGPSQFYTILPYIKTAWIHPFGLGGWGKVNCVLAAVEIPGGNAQSLTLTVQTDNNATVSGGPWAISADGGVAYRSLAISGERACTAVQVQIQATGDDTSTLIKLISVSIEIEPSAGLRLLSDAERN